MMAVEERSDDGLATALDVVVLEDSSDDAQLFGRLLQRAWPGAVRIRIFSRVDDLEAGMGELTPDIVFSDLSVPDGDGLDVVERVVGCAGGAPVVVLTGNADPTAPVLALQRGAQDYMVKEALDTDSLARTLRYSIARATVDRQIRKIARDLIQLNDERDQYAGIVAHDLRAPVRTARLTADRMLAAVERGQDSRPMAEALDRSLERIEAIIDRLLKMATLRDDALVLVEEPLVDIVDDVAADLQADIDAANARLHCLGGGDVRADKVLIRELLRNLVQNSIKYRSPDRVPVVTVMASRIGSDVELVVEDNGIGIEPKYRDRVFRLFERLDPGADTSGLGFGLALCRRVVELHHGSIEILDPAGGQGMAVRIVLPGEDRTPTTRRL